MNARTKVDWPAQRVIVTGGAGFLGSAAVRVIRARGIPEANVRIVRKREFDLTSAEGAARLVGESFRTAGPSCIIHCAGAVGGIQANREQPGRFFHDNLAMTLHLVEQVRQAGLIERAGAEGFAFVQVGSMTSYPADAPIPLREDDLWRGYPDGASAAYGIAKRAAWQMLEAYHRQYGLRAAYVVPVNLYGPGDNIQDLRNAHVAGSLVKRFVDAARTGAAEVVCWGSGAPSREFLYVDDAAEGLVRAAERALGVSGEPTPMNLGSGREVTIRVLAELIAGLTGFSGRIAWDTSKPDGQARRCLDTSRAAELLGWRAAVSLDEGLARTVAWYRSTLGG